MTVASGNAPVVHDNSKLKKKKLKLKEGHL